MTLTQERTALRQRILSANDEVAARLRRRLDRERTLAIDLVSSPGAGKTTLLEATAHRLGASHRLGALVGDVATELDADRLRAAGLPSHQIVTGGACHLDARLVEKGLDVGGLGEVELLFIENVGNLVCPASYDLGEDFKVALLSVAEGSDKPFKYPAIFARASVVLITKADLKPHTPFDLESAERGIRSLNPGARLLEVSARTGLGMDAWCDLLEEALVHKAAAWSL